MAFLLFATCTQPGGLGTTSRVPANVLFYHDTTAITVGTTVAVDVPLAVDFTTFGGGCVRKGDTETRVAGLVARLRPFQYVYHPRPNEVCTAELRIDHNQVTVQFSTTGAARIQIIGLQRPGNQLVTLERNVTVTP